MRASVDTRADFVWLVDDKAIYSYGMLYSPEFYTVSKSAWEQLGKPKKIHIQVSPL